MSKHDAQLLAEVAKRLGLAWTLTTRSHINDDMQHVITWYVVTDDILIGRFESGLAILGGIAASTL